jgi:hypothetical protein
VLVAACAPAHSYNHVGLHTVKDVFSDGQASNLRASAATAYYLGALLEIKAWASGFREFLRASRDRGRALELARARTTNTHIMGDIYAHTAPLLSHHIPATTQLRHATGSQKPLARLPPASSRVLQVQVRSRLRSSGQCAAQYACSVCAACTVA